MRKLAFTALLASSMNGCILQLPSPEPQPAAEKKPESPITWDAKPFSPQPPSPLQASPDWIDIGTANNTAFQIKRGSFRFDRDVSGNYLAVLMGRQIDLAAQDVFFVQWTVRAQDCAAERGPIFAYDTAGNAIWKNDFVFSGGTIAATIAEAICLMAKDATEAVPQQTPAKKPPKPQEQSI